MVVGRKKFISGCILLIATMLLVIVSFDNLSFTMRKLWLSFGFLLIALIAFLNILSDPRIISMNKFNWYFQFVFMGLAPLCNYLSDYHAWGVEVSESDMGLAQCLVVLFNLSYMFFYHKRARFQTNLRVKNRFANFVSVERNYLPGTTVMFLVLGSIGFLALVRLIGFSNLFFRSENTMDIENSTVNFVVRKFLTALPAMLCAILALKDKKEKNVINKMAMIFLAVLTLFSNFPTSTTRYWMGTIFLGLVLIFFIKRKESRIIDYVIMAILLVGFPLFYVFKSASYDITSVFSGGVEYKGIIESFNTVDFDAFSLVARAVRYVRENGMTYGQQLLNIVLFFIPRSIWTSKPITTNVLIAQATGNTFTNLSCPLPAEGFVNFGVFGVVLYAFFYAKFSQWLDETYWENATDGELNIVNIIYPFLCVISLYINRGPLQPSFIQTIALLLPLFVTNFLLSRRKMPERISFYREDQMYNE